jgi:hypothetical protein
MESEELHCVQLIGEFATNTMFSYHVTLPSGTELTVFQPSNKKDMISVSAALFLSSDYIKSLRQKSKREQEEVLLELNFKLAPLDVELTFEGGEIYRRILITHNIYYDALTKDRFFRAVSMVGKAVRLTDMILDQKI